MKVRKFTAPKNNNGNEQKGLDLFKELAKSSISADIRNKSRDEIKDTENRTKVFDGYVVTLNDSFGFVKLGDFQENVYVSRSNINDDEIWDLLNAGDLIRASICFTFRGPRVKNMVLKE